MSAVAITIGYLVLAFVVLGFAALVGASVAIEVAEFIWRMQRWTRSRREACGTKPPEGGTTNLTEVNMRRRFALVGALIAVFALTGYLTGCSSWGNGSVDLPVDISVEWHDNFGNGFTLVDGTVAELTYRSVKTGVLYELTDTGGFLITAPDGTKVRIRRAEPSAEPPTAAAPNPETTSARRHAHAAVG